MSEEVQGRELRVSFEPSRCIHARHCVSQLPEVFQAAVEGPWIQPDAASAEEVLAVVRACPSGALTATRADGAPAEKPTGRNTVRLGENGPYAMRGDLRLKGIGNRTRATLCRCGASASKPFCDNSHRETGFQATSEVNSEVTVPPWEPPGPLKVEPLKDGPLMVTGPHEVCAASGRVLQRGTRSYLCRCGHSKDKPYCDGTHKAVRFSAG